MVNAYMSQATVQTALLIPEDLQTVTYELFNKAVYTAFGLDAVISYTYLYDYLLDQDVSVFIVTADFDQLNGPAGQ